MTVKITEKVTVVSGTFSVADVSVEVQRRNEVEMIYPENYADKAKAGQPVPKNRAGQHLEDTHTFKTAPASKLVGKLVVENETFMVEELLDIDALTKKGQAITGEDTQRLAQALAVMSGLTLEEIKEEE